jgi:hypothetical protein
MILLMVGLFLLAVLIWDARDEARARRERENMRHITGIKPWWKEIRDDQLEDTR